MLSCKGKTAFSDVLVSHLMGWAIVAWVVSSVTKTIRGVSYLYMGGIEVVMGLFYRKHLDWSVLSGNNFLSFRFFL